MAELLQTNLLSPLTLAFALGVVARLLRSDLALPKDVYAGLSLYLLFAIGLKGGVALAQTPLAEIAAPAAATLCLGVLTPVAAYLVLRRAGGFGVADSAGIAAHYGSVSAVTFIAAQQYVERMGAPMEGYLATLLALLEAPGITVALAIGAVVLARQEARAPAVAGAEARGGVYAMSAAGAAAELPGGAPGRHWGEALREVLFGRTMLLLGGGMAIGWLTGPAGFEPVRPFFEGGFKGALVLFLLELGVVAGARLGDLRKVGPFLLAFGTLLPIAHGALGVLLGSWAGLSVGGCAVLGAMASSASYIAAPPAVRLTLPQANPTLSLTAALAITFPFNLVLGIPLYFALAQWVARG